MEQVVDNESQAAEIIFWISCGVGALSLIFIYNGNPLLYSEEAYSQTLSKIDWLKYLTWITFSIIATLAVYVYFVFIRKSGLDWAIFFWMVGLLGLAYTFCIINSTGGILVSPFTAIYPIFASTVITLFPKFRTQAIMVGLITLLLVLHYYTQVKWLNIPSVESNSDEYKLSYTIVIFLLIVLTIIIDSLSRRKQDKKEINN